LVIVTGAGASRELGQEAPLPLMADWCDRLCEALDAHEPGLAAAAGLKPGISGEEFEEALGALLRWQDLRPLNQRFFGLGGSNVGKFPTEVQHCFEREGERLRTVMVTLNASLYREFGAGQISVSSAADAYSWLMSRLHTKVRPVFVTTNYDCSIEMGLEELGFEPNTGFVRRQGLSPKLAPEGLVGRVAGSEREVGVLHLHGAVGWYQQQGEVIEFYADQPYNDTMGVPSVLYPDPEKDPTRDAAVQALWDEFDHALDAATHVLVVGHSMHDRALVERLRRARATIGVCVHAHDDEPQVRKEQLKRVRRLFPSALAVPTRFGPDPWFDLDVLMAWSSGAALIEMG